MARRMGRRSQLSGCPVQFFQERESNGSLGGWASGALGSSFLSVRLDTANALHYKNLYTHYGCINAIEFSPGGDLFVSGGDDRRVMLWDIDMCYSGHRLPRPMRAEHTSNIFSLGFDCHSKKIFSGGNDCAVIVHDISTGAPLETFLHKMSVYGVGVHPSSDTIFTSAGEDGQILLYDTRAPTSDVCLSSNRHAYYAVQFHPIEPLFVVTANSKDGVALWDVRRPGVPMVRYGDGRCTHSAMSARFNRSGTQIVALRRRQPTIIYNTHSTTPVCQFDADHYYNSCTMKSSCFAGDNDQFVLSGSDDFNLYIWKIPEANSQVNFVSDPHLVLRGSRSIVNQVRFNPHNFLIASSGVEKVVKLWSGLCLPGSSNSVPSMMRKKFTHDDYVGLVMETGQSLSHDYSNGSTSEDPRMMAFFDSLVQREVDGCTSSDASDDSTSDEKSITSESGDNDANDVNDDQSTDDNSLSNDWIMELISRKRAQLKQAKKARRKQKQINRIRLLQSLPSKSRYYYKPKEGQPSINESSVAASESGSSSGPSRKRRLAPYTIMLLNHDDSVGECSTSTETINCLDRNESVNEMNYQNFLSADNSSSSDENDACISKNQALNYIIHSDSDGSDSEHIQTVSPSNGHIISELISTDDSDNSSETKEDNSRCSNSELKQSTSNSNLDNLFASSSCYTECDNTFNSNSNVQLNYPRISQSEQEHTDSELHVDNTTTSDVMPISGITMDDKGTVLFDLDQNSHGSGFDSHQNSDLNDSSTSTSTSTVQNNNNNNDMTLHELLSSDNNEPANSDQIEHSLPGVPEHRPNLIPNFRPRPPRKFDLFKKRILKYTMKKYRLHNEDEDP